MTKTELRTYTSIEKEKLYDAQTDQRTDFTIFLLAHSKC